MIELYIVDSDKVYNHNWMGDRYGGWMPYMNSIWSRRTACERVDSHMSIFNPFNRYMDGLNTGSRMHSKLKKVPI